MPRAPCSRIAPPMENSPPVSPNAAAAEAPASSVSVSALAKESTQTDALPAPRRLASLHAALGSASSVSAPLTPPPPWLRAVVAGGGNFEKKGAASEQPAQPQQQRSSPVKRRKLLRGGLRVKRAEDSSASDSSSPSTSRTRTCRSADAEETAPALTAEAEPEDSDDEEALDALQLCLQESEMMTDALVQELGGPSPEAQAKLRAEIGQGRCRCRESLHSPPGIPQVCAAAWQRLKAYQKCGVHWLLALHKADRNGIVADEMGLGKTAQTCVFLDFAYASGLLSLPTLVAVPASLVDNWIREFEVWAPGLAGRVVKYAGKQSERRALAIDCIDSLRSEAPFRVLVASVNSLASRNEAYLKQLRPFAYLVVDEAHALKNKDSQVFKKVNRVADCDRRILLTGSPIQNRTEELRNLLLFLMPNVFDEESIDLALSAFKQQSDVHNRSALATKKEADLLDGKNDGTGETSSAPQEEEQQQPREGKKGILEKLSLLASSQDGGTKAGRGLPADVVCLQRILSPFILRRLKSEVMRELPKKTNVVLRCELEGEQKELYVRQVLEQRSELALSLRRLNSLLRKKDAEEILAAKSETAEGEAGTAKESAAAELGGGKRFVNSLLFRLRRICNHTLLMQSRYTQEQKDRLAHYYAHKVDGFRGNSVEKVRSELEKWSDFEVHSSIRSLAEAGDTSLWDLALPGEAFLESAKLRKAIELLREVQSRGEKALVFSHFTTFLDVVEEALRIHFPQLRFCRLDGSTVPDERQRLVDAFNRTDAHSAFLLSTKAGGQGLNLTAARTVILLDQDWNPQTDRQAEDRVHRLGQTHDVTVYRLCCRGTVEESILKCCQRKLDLDTAFGGDSEVLQAAILQDAFEGGGDEGEASEPLVSLSFEEVTEGEASAQPAD